MPNSTAIFRSTSRSPFAWRKNSETGFMDDSWISGPDGARRSHARNGPAVVHVAGLGGGAATVSCELEFADCPAFGRTDCLGRRFAGIARDGPVPRRFDNFARRESVRALSRADAAIRGPVRVSPRNSARSSSIVAGETLPPWAATTAFDHFYRSASTHAPRRCAPPTP